jgi:chromosome segregation ATPase
MSAYNRYFSPSQVESDQKDLLISQIKAEIFELKQNERDYLDLASQLRSIEHRYNLLQEEKLRAESDFKGRNDINFKTIANLKTDIDTLKSNIAEANIEYQELKAENQAIKDIAEQRDINIKKLKHEVGDSLEQNDNLNQQRRTLESELLSLKEEKRRLNAKIDNAAGNLDEVNYKNAELEKITKELDYDKSTLERQNAQLQASIENANAELRTREDNLETIERQVADTQKTIGSLEADIQDLERVNERTRAEAVQQQRSVQQEVGKNLDLTARTNTLENNLRSRELEAAELKREIENIKNIRSNNLDNKYQLEQELDVVRRDIENMSSQNEDLVAELERFSREDEKARVMLDRRERVAELKHKSHTQLKQTNLNKSKFDRSPSPKRASPVRRYGKY